MHILHLDDEACQRGLLRNEAAHTKELQEK